MPNNGIVFQDGVESYKNTIDLRRDGAIHGDFIYSFQKADSFNSVEEKFDWRNIVEGVFKTIFATSPFVSNSDLYTAINLVLLPKLFCSLDTCKKHSSESIADLTLRNLEKVIENHLTREGNIWRPKVV